MNHRFRQRGGDRRGQVGAIAGAISMDLTSIDVTDCPPMAPGDAVTLLGREGSVSLDAQQIARTAGDDQLWRTVRIGQRVKRVYL